MAQAGSRRRLGRGPGRAPGRHLVRADGDDLLDGADRQALGHDPVRQVILGLGVLQAQQRPGVARAQHARRHALLHGRRQVQQPEGVADVRAGAADLARQFLVGRAEVIQQLLVGRGLFQRVELLPVQVLDQRVPEQVVVLRSA